jgi:Carboxypeptidase regulatory-like domain
MFVTRALRSAAVAAFACASAWAAAQSISGRVTDPQGQPVQAARVRLEREGAAVTAAATDSSGRYTFASLPPARYELRATAGGFAAVETAVTLEAGRDLTVDLQFSRLASRAETVTVTADVNAMDIEHPDPAQRVNVREDILDANPGRPGAPVSIPGLPIETASSGIKAPQYFAPGVAGDHGEPIAQYLQVGSYLLPNNLSANAHGNGYSDPNIMVPEIIASVETDGGAFNVLEGNHSVDLAAVYGFRQRLEPSVTLTADYRDIDLVAGWSPANPETRAWLAIEASYGNGFLDTLEHRQQYKINGFRVFDIGRHELTLFGIGYYGQSMIPGLTPIDVPNLHDTIDPRQRDQTHTGEFALNDVWRLAPANVLQLSSFFRTYNLSLYSNFGDGLIRQSEFRTVNGSNVTWLRRLSESFGLMAGMDHQRDAPRRLDLDRYESTDPAVYGPFQPVSANNVTINILAPYLAIDGHPTHWFYYDLGWRRDEIDFANTDLLHPVNSYQEWAGVNSPKATIGLIAPASLPLPSVAFSFGQAFFTNDPRIGNGSARGTPVSRAHAYQMVISKTFLNTDFRVTLARVTQEESLAKIDPDTGLQFNEGPSRDRYITVSARHYFRGGLLQASVSKADARDLSDGTPIPEAPRTIVDVLGTLDRLPWQVHARGEFEEVGSKALGDGFVGVPVREFRGALARRFGERLQVGVDFLIASGYTGQTTEVLALPGEGEPFERVVGVYLPSYATVSFSYRFGRIGSP